MIFSPTDTAPATLKTEPFCGVWVAPTGGVHVAVATADGRREERIEHFRPFAWIEKSVAPEVLAGFEVQELPGDAPFSRLAHAERLEDFQRLLSVARETSGIDLIRPFENQFLLQRRARLFGELPFNALRRCQLDIETAAEPGHFSDPRKKDDRVLAIGLQFGDRQRLLVLAEQTDVAERALLKEFAGVLREEDPDIIEGHNLFKFDLEYLRMRCRRFKLACDWGRFGQVASFRNSRLKVAERWVDFPRCDIPGRAVVDTYLLVQLYDITTRELTSFGLKDVAVYFGITEEDAAESGGRTYLDASRISEIFATDRAKFLAYLAGDLRETKGLAEVLLPTYVEQARTFPILLQDATLRGTTSKIDLLFLEEYYHQRQACPVPPEVKPFEGGYTRSFQEGVYRHVLHFDVASLYPSLLLQIARNPKNDPLGVFIPLLRQLREYRLRYKLLARTAETEELRSEYQARQSNFKILINSFYGYLGFSGARFGDGELAAEVTRRGRELLQVLIDEFAKHDCTILEADTDGIYLSSHEFFDRPEELLAKTASVIPNGIELEFDGRYQAMFCYKAKNYVLYDGHKMIIRGSALRSRGIEPYLKKLSDHLMHFLVGASADSPVKEIEKLREEIRFGRLPVQQLAKTEVISQNPDAYEKWVAEGGKPRRASAEAALQQVPRPRMGDRVTYYVSAAMNKTADWQRAKPIGAFDAVKAPYDREYYLNKLDEWVERYGPFLGIKPKVEQTEFLLE
ncbi:MAG TPA: DNA polymerase domain-containing protein [Opitutaceae bacterium]|nr:DNA polymerase domain-containing protein [Opitutaceae bacterium]